MKSLKALGTEQTRKIYRKHGYAAGEMFGVSMADLQKLKKQIKTDHALARQLWATKNLDAQVLATMVAEPKLITSKALDAWVKDITFHMLADLFVRNLVSKTQFAKTKMESWAKSKSEFVAQAGWELLALLGMQAESGIPDEEFIDYLGKIEAGAGTAKNRAKYAMLGALIAIGGRNLELRKAAEAAAKRIGPVEIDHGDTACKTPEPISYIAKMWNRKKTKAAGLC